MATILCIDQPEVLSTRRLVLEKNGHTVRIAHTVDEALKLLGQDAVDCVLARHDPPLMDGLGALAAIRRRHPQLPVVLLSPFPSGDGSLADECLSNLEGPEALTAAIERVLANRPAQGSQSALKEERQQWRERLHRNLRDAMGLLVQSKKLQAKTIELLRRIQRLK